MAWDMDREGMSLDSAVPGPPVSEAEGLYEVQVLDVYFSHPYKPVYAVSIRALELYRTTHLRCPHLAVEPFVKMLCDIYRVCYRSSLRLAFSNCYDVYLRLRREREKLVKVALNRTGLWRRKNACPACTYRLHRETKMTFGMLVTMDGNDSLKRILRGLLDASYLGVEDEDEEASRPTRNSEREDPRSIGEDIYITREAANRWNWETRFDGNESREADMRNEEEGDSPCASRWHNMSKEATAKAWGIFDETGLFLCLCRHGYVLAMVDMVRSGELSKYPLAVVEALLDAFGDNIGCGYDIGCKFSSTLKDSALGSRAAKANFRSLVGSFHGHAHNRVCQLSNLANYVEGLGLEDLEGCERFFSKSNALAGSVRYASGFHRQQAIEEYCKHVDAFETSQNISKFIVDNYKQALLLIAGEDELKRQMELAGIESADTFREWLQQEREYLDALKTEPPEETLKMDYYLSLKMWKKYQEDAERAIKAVQSLKIQLNIQARWTSSSEEWKEAKGLLERLIVSRMFELTKANMSQTGYKLRKHISTAIQTRSQAIRTALGHYNAAAAELKPPRPSLSWSEVVEYAFLADFDLLRDTRNDIRTRPWAQPVNRALRDRYFKIERAREEVTRLNVEIKRVVTHIRDEENFLLAAEEENRAADGSPTLMSYHISSYRHERTLFSSVHIRRFNELSKLPGFTGKNSLIPGVSLDPTLRNGSGSLRTPSDPLAAHTTVVDLEKDLDEVEGKDPNHAEESRKGDEGDADLEARFRAIEVTS
ncbi:hypothetical protein DFP72DRAFT_986985 [Ephemerocybe angulata]|uniref:CxC1-like cysteine cluster associated with KDZ transposases domain-containing protein n=1 Tax=Ephemerocybe angulata TaxID=980116 RepID=A0A8H6ID89_9AGAR|nr:hypothetical protein DFP72DRAFT_986985 [Tulosesus angulatus]